MQASNMPSMLAAARGTEAATDRVEPVGQESLALLDGGRQAYPRMLQAIAASRRSVHFEMYGFAKSGTGALFIEALADAARRGVAVRVHIDGWGSAHGGRHVAGALREAGCTVRIYNRLRTMLVGRFGRNHRKVMLVDDEVAFIGGINIGDENVSEGLRLGWADLALEIRGPQCRALAQMIRRKSRVLCYGSLRIDFCGLGGGWRLRRQYLEAIAGARRRIDLAHGYFLPDRGIVRALTRASRRGVAVCLLLPGRSDIPLVRAATRGRYRRLLAAGIQIREWDGSVLHAKVAACDGRRLLVGSFNLDPFSLVNHEALVQVVDRDVVERGQAWIEDHFARSREITLVEASSRLHRWLFEPLGHLVALMTATAGRMIAGRSQRQVRRDDRASSGWPPGVIGDGAGRATRPSRGSAMTPDPVEVQMPPPGLGLAAASNASLRLGRVAASTSSLTRKIGGAAVGLSVLGLGLALVVLPGPSVLVIPLGLTILAKEFHWARRLLQPVHKLRRHKARAAASRRGTIAAHRVGGA